MERILKQAWHGTAIESTAASSCQVRQSTVNVLNKIIWVDSSSKKKHPSVAVYRNSGDCLQSESRELGYARFLKS